MLPFDARYDAIDLIDDIRFGVDFDEQPIYSILTRAREHLRGSYRNSVVTSSVALWWIESEWK